MPGTGARTRLITCCVVVGIGLAICARGATPTQVEQSITKARSYLYSKQKNGNWEKSPARDPATKPWEADGAQWGWTTALATYALLSSGEAHTDPRIKQATDFLAKADLIGVYAFGARACVWSLL